MTQSPLLAAVATAFIVVTALCCWLRFRRAKPTTTPEAMPKGRLLTPNEAHFFGLLRHALPEFDVFPQVSQGALLTLNVPETHPLFWAARSRFDKKIADFVVCDTRTTQALCVIELDDRTHDKRKDGARDAVVAQAGIPTLRYESRAKPNSSELRRSVLDALQGLPQFQAHLARSG